MPRILLVDDDPEFLGITKEFLLQEEPALDILTTPNPSKALEITRTQSLDAIVSDYQMPEMDGLQLLAQIRTDGNFLPFIMFTGRGREEVAIKALNLGANRYLKKEVGGAELFAELAHTLNSLIQYRASEEKYRALFDTAGDAIFTIEISDKDPRFIDCNPNTLRLFGCRYEEIIGKSPIDFSPPLQPDGSSSAESIKETAAKAMAGEPQQLEWVHCRLDKTPFDAEVTVHRVDIGSETYLQAIVRDISYRKKAEKDLRESEERYRSLVENIPFGMYRTTPGPKGKFLMANSAMVNILGYESEAALKEVDVVDVYFDPNEREIYADRFLAQGGMVGEEIRLKKKDGTLIWGAITSRAIYQDDGKIAFFDGLLEDITKRKRAEQALLESEKRYRTFIQNFLGIAFEGRLDFTPIFFHGAVEEITGYTESNFLSGTPRWDQCIHPDDLTKISRSIEEIASIPGFSIRRRYRIIRKDGEIRWVYEVIQNVCDENGQPKRVQGVILDITDRQQAIEELLASQQRLAIAAEAGGAGIYDYTVPFGPNSYHSERWAQILGYSLDELPSYNIFMEWLSNQIHPDDLPQFKIAYSELLQNPKAKFNVE
ncbi:MAG: response regulator, partial [Candidatus Hodarchaeales archaeon]